MTVKQLFDDARNRLATVMPFSEARETVIIIFENLKKWSLTDILVKGDENAGQWLIEQTYQVVTRILDNEPIQYIFGNAHFYGMRLKVTSDVLIPRPETAQLVDIIIDDNKNRSDLKVLDIATGSGCIAIALARNLKFPEVEAFDISEKALDVARENASRMKTGIKFYRQDILKLAFESSPKFDIIVSNPPYIALKEAQTMDANVLDHEPAEALFVPDDDPLKFYLPVNKYSLTALNPGGHLYFEINPLYASVLKDTMLSDGWEYVDVITDMQGHKRFIVASLHEKQ